MLPANILQVFAVLTVLSYGYCSDDNLQGFIFITKHGQKSLESTYPNDPYQGEDYWPDGYAQLTIKGKQRMYAIGEQIKQRYGQLLPTNPHQVNVRSFDTGPCLESAAQLLAGAFPPQGRWKWSEQLNWQPFSIRTRPGNQDKIFAPIVNCPKAREEMENLEQSEEVIKFRENNKNLISYIEFKSGIDRLSFNSLVNLYDALTVERVTPLPFPTWINDTVYNFIETFYTKLVYEYYSSPSCTSLLAGPLLEKISENLKIIQYGSEKDEKVFIYSGKESNLISLLAALEINTTQLIVPSFGSVMAIKVFKTDNKPTLQIEYLDGEEMLNWRTLKLDKCDSICPLLEFYNIVDNIRSHDWRQDCTNLEDEGEHIYLRSKLESESPDSKKENYTVYIVSCGVLIVVLTVLLMYFVVRKRKRVNYIII